MNQKLKKILDNFLDNNSSFFKTIKKTNNSWTNVVYEIKTQDNEVFFIRIKKHFKNLLEPIVFKSFFKNEYYYDLQSHNIISESLNPFKLRITKSFVKYIIDWINDFQKFGSLITNQSKIYFKFEEYKNLTNKNKLLDYYISLYKKENKNLVLSHNDLSEFNLLKTKVGNYQIIDFEYTAYNLEWWDLFNFMRSLDKNNFNKMKKILINEHKFNKKTIYKYLFLTTFYAYLWSLNAYKNFLQLSEIKKYSFQTYKLSKKFLNKFLKLNNY